ncbi:MAG TPA: PLP-dependent aminotransferase family protein [Candidatus Baltobacteraceae bacterium]|jgi:DNA-binding transcriptional MocR family regulator|nr:PLP-dependent aminotransferase family protein [Candidatus Baltobacteraceae bacterium]
MGQTGWSPVATRIDRDSIVPIYQQIYEEMREAILSGALPEGTRLPPERGLAERLGVNRSTVVHAYRDLAADGLIEQKVGSGSRVALRDDVSKVVRTGSVPWWVTLPSWQVGAFPAVLGELASAEHGASISFVQGVPPLEPSPLPELATSFERVAGDPRYVLSYGNSEGHPPLREAIAERMRARGCRVGPREILILTGSTQGLTLVAQSLAEAGDEIIVEQPSYPGALQIFQIAGLRAIPVAVDDDGLRVDHVEEILRTRRPRFIYTMPSFHNPTGVMMNADRRERLVTLASRAHVPIIEDDPYGVLTESELLPLASRSSEIVVYLSTFSKTIAPSLRLGWLSAPRMIYERLLLRKQSQDMATSLYVQTGVHDFLNRAYDGHVVALRAELAARRRIARETIDEYWPKTVRVANGLGGFYFWVTAPREMRARSILERAERRGVSFLFGEPFFAAAGGDHNFRLSISPVTHEQLVEGLRRIGELLTS